MKSKKPGLPEIAAKQDGTLMDFLLLDAFSLLSLLLFPC